jgi:hypothetical protein
VSADVYSLEMRSPRIFFYPFTPTRRMPLLFQWDIALRLRTHSREDRRTAMMPVCLDVWEPGTFLADLTQLNTYSKLRRLSLEDQ